MSTYHRSAELSVDFETVVEVLRECGPVVLGALDEEGRRAHPDLGAHLFGVDVSHPVTVIPGEVELAGEPFHIATVTLRIEASDHEGWFPVFEGDLEVVGLPHGTVEVAMEGGYRPPGGAVGVLGSAAGLHRIAEESLELYFTGVLERLQQRCGTPEDVGGTPV